MGGDDVALFKLEDLLDVLPVDGVQTPCHTEEQEQEQQNPYAQALALKLYWFGHPAKEVGQVGNLTVELCCKFGINGSEGHFVRSAAGVALQDFRLHFLETLWVEARNRALPLLGAVGLVDQSDLAALHAAGALQRPQRMRHAYAREDKVVPALRTRGIAVEGAQESIDVVHASGAQVMGLGACNDGEVRRSSTKPL